MTFHLTGLPERSEDVHFEIAKVKKKWKVAGRNHLADARRVNQLE
jgi:hypothetical protein